MGNSKYLDSLSIEAKRNLSQNLWEIQNHKCFICEQEIDLDINNTNIDHIRPLANGGKDEPSNFAITHEHCNKSKQDADLVVEDASVSRVHALIMKEDDGYYLEDLNSLNGTYLNGSQLEIKEKVRLSSKDEIHIGKSCLVFQDLRY